MKKGLVESSNRLETYSDIIDQIKITAYGLYIYDHLAFNFAYIDLVCIDSGLFSEEMNNYLSKSANDESKLKQNNRTMERILLRLDRAEQYVKYIEQQEQEEFEHFNFDNTEIQFSKRLRESFDEEKKKVLTSAKRNT